MVGIHNWAVASLLLLGSLPSSEGGKVSSTLKVNLPKNLAGSYDHREALFGIPPYGGSIEQKVIYTTEDLCAPPTDATKWHPPFILLIDRGGCSFVQKVRNAQHAGAAAAVIADNACQCKHMDKCSSGLECELHEPIMADDGSGFDITIPSVLMFKQDADPVKDALISGSPVRMELGWSLPNPDDHVEWDLWTHPLDYAATAFKLEFKETAVALKGRAEMTPHEYFYDGLESGCINLSTKENMCGNMCTNKGRYCANDPYGDQNFGISGADVVSEGARRACIWDIYGKDDGVGEEWWDYIREFEANCDTADLFMKDSCIRDISQTVNVDFDLVEQCLYENGGLTDDQENKILQNELDAKAKAGIVVLPVVHVNGVPIRGGLEFPTVFKAICAGFKSGTEPDVCVECSSCSDAKNCVDEGFCFDPIHGHNGIEVSTFLESMVALSIAFMIAGTIVYIRQRAEMRDEIRGIMDEYMPVDISNQKNFDTALSQDDDDKGTFA